MKYSNITLRWEYTSELIDEFVIYRSNDKSNVISDSNIISTSDRFSREFIDKYIFSNVKYYYVIGAKYNDTILYSDTMDIISGENNGIGLRVPHIMALNKTSITSKDSKTVDTWSSVTGDYILDSTSLGGKMIVRDDGIFVNETNLYSRNGTIIDNKDVSWMAVIFKLDEITNQTICVASLTNDDGGWHRFSIRVTPSGNIDTLIRNPYNTNAIGTTVIGTAIANSYIFAFIQINWSGSNVNAITSMVRRKDYRDFRSFSRTNSSQKSYISNMGLQLGTTIFNGAYSPMKGVIGSVVIGDSIISENEIDQLCDDMLILNNFKL